MNFLFLMSLTAIFTALSPQPGQIFENKHPRLPYTATFEDRVFVASSQDEAIIEFQKITTAEDQKWVEQRRFASKGHFYSIDTHPDGFAVACANSGKQIVLLNLTNNTAHTFDLETYETEGVLDCLRARLSTVKGHWSAREPVIWFTNPSKKRVIKMNWAGDIVERFSPIRGAWDLAVGKAHVFASQVIANIQEMPMFLALPFAFHGEFGSTALGNSLGIPTDGLEFGYRPDIFYDRAFETAYFFRPTENRIDYFEVDKPSAPKKSIRPTIRWADSATRVGEWIYVMGTSDEAHGSKPEFEKFKINGAGQLLEPGRVVKEIDTINLPSLFAITSTSSGQLLGFGSAGVFELSEKN